MIRNLKDIFAIIGLGIIGITFYILTMIAAKKWDWFLQYLLATIMIILIFKIGERIFRK